MPKRDPKALRTQKSSYSTTTHTCVPGEGTLGQRDKLLGEACHHTLSPGAPSTQVGVSCWHLA